MEQYGLWLVVGSLVAWGGVTDLGLAPGLLNVMSAAKGRNDREAMRRAVSTAFAIYGVMAIGLTLLTIGVSGWSGLPALLGARKAASAESVRLLFVVCGLIFAASTLTRLVNTTTTALQEGYLGSCCQLAGSLASLSLLFALTWRRGGLLTYTLVVSVPPLLAQLGLAGYVFGWRHRDLRPAWRWCDERSVKSLLGIGAPLMIHQLSDIALLYSANLLIGNRLGPAEAANYSVPYTAYSLVTGMVWLLVASYLPALSEASARKDWEWIEKRAKQAFIIGVGVTALSSAVLYAEGAWLVKTWTRGSVSPSLGLLLALGFFSVTAVGSAITSLWLQGLTLVHELAWIHGTTAILMVLAAWLMLPILGVVAIPACFGLGAGIQVFTKWCVWSTYLKRVKC